MQRKSFFLRHRAYAPFLALLLAIVFTFMLATSAWAATIHFTGTFSLSNLNPCNGKTVQISGEYRDVGQLTLDHTGGYHLVDHENAEGTGIDAQGNKYVINDSRNLEFNGKVALAYSIADKFHIVSKGAAPNFLMHENLYLTVYPNGTVKIHHDNYHAVCSG